jgi:hypothetical protein
MDLNPTVAQANEIDELRNLSTERLIVWIVGRSKEISLKLTPEEIVLECWLINPEKHSLRGYRQFGNRQVVRLQTAANELALHAELGKINL